MVAISDRWSDMLAASAQIGQYGFDAVLVDQAQAGVGEPQADPAVFAFDPEATALQVRQKAPLGLVVGVRNVVSHHRGLTGDLADTSHGSFLLVCVFNWLNNRIL